ncbi:hypothetical protein FisN_3Lh051 [Fistulifera solaris]|uniref:Uncharacterized protein n=1 Tax=Fistulifera solaris TaxID=1519565 RepID=A0A1Z5JYJ9_FISSO|nr:hypothetical protein FisN_3Lh051 [Fistulifera solaris]|eukprot:GAX19113.1 hypothetical protein FisN_3Lh051 [Fistulifera solaris]
MNKYLSTQRLIFIASFLMLQGTTLVNAQLTCPNELASYQECIANQPLYCFPTCGKVAVRVQPEDLKYMMDPSLTCDPMKLASCAMRGCCKQCSVEEATYWACIEREAGCGEIDCEAVLAPDDEPQEEETPTEEENISTSNTGGSNGQGSNTNNGENGDGQSGEPPLQNNTNSGTNPDNSAGSSGSNTSGSEELTCPGELGIFKQCVASKSCATSCANVDVTLKADDLTEVSDPSVLCLPMEIASCAQRSCCEDCALEEFLYWFCIERETGCGAIDCRDVPAPTSTGSGSIPTGYQTPPVEGNEGTTPVTGGSGTTTANNTSNGDAAPSDGDCDCQNATKPITGGSSGQTNTTKPTTSESTGVTNTTKPATGGSSGTNNITNPVTGDSNGSSNTTTPVTGGSSGTFNTTKPIAGGSSGQGVAPATNDKPVVNNSSSSQSSSQNTTTNEGTSVVNNSTNSSTTSNNTSGMNSNQNVNVGGSGSSSSNSGGLTCPNELASYQECIANQPLYCFPTCGKVAVRVQPEDLKYMMDPSLTCDPMKLASCAMRGCCKQCSVEEATYWACIEREAGCGEIDCQAILDPIDGDRATNYDAIEGTEEITASSSSHRQKNAAWLVAPIALLLHIKF